jgi:hypothetical protein
MLMFVSIMYSTNIVIVFPTVQGVGAVSARLVDVGGVKKEVNKRWNKIAKESPHQDDVVSV